MGDAIGPPSSMDLPSISAVWHLICNRTDMGASNLAVSPEQIGCEVCLALQTVYSAAMRRYADVLERRTQALAQGI